MYSVFAFTMDREFGRPCFLRAVPFAANGAQTRNLNPWPQNLCSVRNDVLAAAAARWPVQELMERILRDRTIYKASGGGVTFSGGEPL